MSARVVLARYAPVRTLLLVVLSAGMTYAALGLTQVSLGDLWRHWAAQPFSAVVFLPVIGAWIWMWLAVGWQLVVQGRAALWLDGSRIRTVFWSCALADIETVEPERVEEFGDLVLHLRGGNKKRMSALVLEGETGQIAVRVAHASERRRVSP